MLLLLGKLNGTHVCVCAVELFWPELSHQFWLALDYKLFMSAAEIFS